MMSSRGLSSNNHTTFDKVSKRMVCLCMSICICGSCSQELSVELYILHEGTYIRVSTISVPNVFQVAFQIFTFSEISTCYNVS